MAADRPGKVLMTTRAFHNLDQGSHSCTSREDPIPADISFLHLHNRPFTWLLNASRAKLLAHGVDIEDRSALLEHREHHGPCWPICDLLLFSEAEWLARLHQEDTVPCEAFSNRLQQLGLEHPFSHAAPRRQGGERHGVRGWSRAGEWALTEGRDGRTCCPSARASRRSRDPPMAPSRERPPSRRGTHGWLLPARGRGAEELSGAARGCTGEDARAGRISYRQRQRPPRSMKTRGQGVSRNRRHPLESAR